MSASSNDRKKEVLRFAFDESFQIVGLDGAVVGQDGAIEAVTFLALDTECSLQVAMRANGGDLHTGWSAEHKRQFSLSKDEATDNLVEKDAAGLDLSKDEWVSTSLIITGAIVLVACVTGLVVFFHFQSRKSKRA